MRQVCEGDDGEVATVSKASENPRIPRLLHDHYLERKFNLQGILISLLGMIFHVQNHVDKLLLCCVLLLEKVRYLSHRMDSRTLYIRVTLG